MNDLRDVLLRPVVSEKSYGLMSEGKYVFVVRPDANKVEIRYAVEQAFGVEVTDVNTLNRKGKKKRNRGRSTYGKRPDFKRAIVTLASGQSIPVFEGAE